MTGVQTCALPIFPKRRKVNIRLQGAEFPGQSRLTATQEDGTDVVVWSGLPGILSNIQAEERRWRETRWTQQWIETGKFLVSRQKNTQLWDITRGWNRTVWQTYMDQSGMRRPFDPLYKGLIIPDDEVE